MVLRNAGKRYEVRVRVPNTKDKNNWGSPTGCYEPAADMQGPISVIGQTGRGTRIFNPLFQSWLVPPH